VRIIAGQGTLAVELLEQARDLGRPLDVLIAPVGGGGMLSGVALATKALSPDVWVVGAEPTGADDAFRSFTSRTFQPSVNPKTIADGLLTSTGQITFPLIMEHVDAIYTVTDEQIM
jgi:threonine dehydratase